MENKTLGTIEASRGVAALLVVVYHISRHFNKNFDAYPFTSITNIGHTGVDFFFVLSGFIIYYIHEKDIGKRKHLFTYGIKRFSRVFPFYWFVLIVSLVLILVNSPQNIPSLQQTISQLLLLPVGLNDLIVGVSWTLQYEIAFYLFFGLLILSFRAGLIFGAVWMIAILCVRFLDVDIDYSPLKFLLSAYVYQFFLGMLAAWFFRKNDIHKYQYFIFGGLLILAIMYAFEVFANVNGHEGLSKVIYGGAFAILLIGLVTFENIKRIKVPALLIMLGSASYSIYLMHLIFNGIYYKLFEFAGLLDVLALPLSAALLIMLSVGSCVVISKLIELPLSHKIKYVFLNFKSKVTNYN